MMKQIQKSAWIFGGTVCIGLGLLGVFLPILPTTPFLLLAAFCYGRGSKRFYHWLVHQSWAGNYIQNYLSGNGIPAKQKAFTIALLWLTIGATIGLVNLAWWLNVVLLIVAVSVTIHLIKMKTRLPDKKQLMDPIETIP